MSDKEHKHSQLNTDVNGYVLYDPKEDKYHDFDKPKGTTVLWPDLDCATIFDDLPDLAKFRHEAPGAVILSVRVRQDQDKLSPVQQQDAFDQVLKAIREQGGCCIEHDGDGPMYRDEKGRRSPGGILISDDRYTHWMELHKCNDERMNATLFKEEGFNPDFVEALQEVHDDAALDYYTNELDQNCCLPLEDDAALAKFEVGMEEFADTFVLEYVAPEKL